MWKRNMTFGAVTVALLVVAGVALATVGASSETSTRASLGGDISTSDDDQSTSTIATAQFDAAAATSTAFEAGEAGRVSVAADGGLLVITSVDSNPGWTFEIEQASGLEVEVKFLSGDTRIDFEAELEDGEIRIRVRTRDIADDDDGVTTSTTLSSTSSTSTTIQSSDGTHVIDAGLAGSVTVQVANGALTLVSIDASPGWDATVVESSASEIEVELRSLGLEAEVEIELEHGQLQFDVEMKAHGGDDSSGPGGGDDDSSGHDGGGDD